MLADIAALQSENERLNEKIDRTSVLLTGNGHPEQGVLLRLHRLEQGDVDQLLVRLDRLEQAESRRSWIGKTTVGAAIAAVVAAIVALLRVR